MTNQVRNDIDYYFDRVRQIEAEAKAEAPDDVRLQNAYRAGAYKAALEGAVEALKRAYDKLACLERRGKIPVVPVDEIHAGIASHYFTFRGLTFYPPLHEAPLAVRDPETELWYETRFTSRKMLEGVGYQLDNICCYDLNGSFVKRLALRG